MKSLLLLLMLSLSILIGESEAPPNTDQGVSMQMETETVFQRMVKIYSYDGSLIREFTLQDVANDDITLADHMILEASDFAFDHLGDYYYFGDSSLESIIN